MKGIIAAIASLVIPGLGQLILGEWTLAAIWFFLGFCFPGIANILSAVHALMLTD
jgi:TM2 domain-containing membrane protein YozV